MNDSVLIYSLEHRAFWKANSFGYTPEQSQAGVYDLETAKDIIEQANSHGAFNEVIIQPFSIIAGTLLLQEFGS